MHLLRSLTIQHIFVLFKDFNFMLKKPKQLKVNFPFSLFAKKLRLWKSNVEGDNSYFNFFSTRHNSVTITMVLTQKIYIKKNYHGLQKKHYIC